jgi:translocation and assembly module TamB
MKYQERLAHFNLNLRLNPATSQFQGSAVAALNLNFTAAESLHLQDILEFKIQSQNLDLALLALFTPELQHVTGDIELQADFKNLLTEPQGTGFISINKGQFYSPQTNITYTDITARGELNANKIQLNQFRLRAPQGEMSAQGSLTFRHDNIEQFTIRTNFQDFLAMNTSDYQAKIGGEAGLNGDLNHQNFWGNITLLASDIQIPAVAATPAPDISTEIYPFTVDSARPASIPTPATPPLVERLRGTIRIKIPRNCWVRNNLVNVELSGELNLIKEAKDWTLFGNVTVSRGTVEFYGRKFNIDKGLIQFQGQSPPNPQLYIIASNRLRPIRTESISIQVIVGGTANTPQITLQSEPYLEQKDILAYLVFGKPFDFLTSNEQNQMHQTSNSYTQQVGEILVGMAAKQLGQLIAKQLELDIVEFDISSP